MPLPLPLSAILIILVDLGFELSMALQYAYDEPESKAMMKLPPRIPVTQETIRKHKAHQELIASGKETLIHKVTRLVSDKEGETLVDSGLLSWSYIEAGSIETIGCLVCFFFALYAGFGITPADAVTNASNLGSVDSITLASGRVLVVFELR